MPSRPIDMMKHIALAGCAAMAVSLSGAGGFHATRRNTSGVSRFSIGMFNSVANSEIRVRAVFSRASASGFRVDQARGGGKLSPGTRS